MGLCGSKQAPKDVMDTSIPPPGPPPTDPEKIGLTIVKDGSAKGDGAEGGRQTKDNGSPPQDGEHGELAQTSSTPVLTSVMAKLKARREAEAAQKRAEASRSVILAGRTPDGKNAVCLG
eukprot:4962845-Prymnesium_polylepis.1